MNVLSCLLFPNSIGRIEKGTESAMPDLRRMRTSSYHSPWVAPRHGPRHSKGGLKRLGARGRLVRIAYGRVRPLLAGPPSRVRAFFSVARMPRTTREVREPATRAWRVRTVSSKSLLTVVDLREDRQARQHDRSAVRLTQVSPPAVHQARRANSYPSHRLREVAAASGRCSLNRLPGSRS